MFTKYSDYKKTDHDWIGNIPLDWEIKRVGHHVDFLTGFAFKSEFFSFEEGIKIVRGDNVTEGALRWGDKTRYWPSVTKELEIYLLKDKDILIGMDGSKVGKNFTVVYERDLPLLLVQRVARLRVDEFLDYRFLAHLISSELFRTWVSIVKTDPAIPHISPADIKGFPLPFPSLFEQQQIANFLDHETAKIDTLIEQQQQLIQLLKEKRQAVISHAVTKGLNPNASMKNSGVEWLGEVPAHWVICRLKHIKSLSQNAFVDGPFGSNLKSEHFIDNGDVYVIESNFATTGEIDASSLKTISNAHFETIKRSEATAGDIIIAKIGARFGMSSILPSLDKKSVVSGNSLKLTVNANVVTRMYAHKLLTVLKEMGAMDDGVNGSAQPALSLGELNNLLFLVPPIQEQIEIESFIQLNQDKFDVLLEKANLQVRLLQERRTALISAAVTGKIDLRNWQAPQQ